MYRPNLFINPSDHMGFDVLIDKQWDQFLTASIRSVSSLGGDDLFIDIGANIGLISVQVEDVFGKIIALEPNPIAFGVLQANTITNIASKKLSLRNYGLGARSENAKLDIPLNNLGGAFVQLGENLLTEKELTKKEGGELHITKSLEIRVESASAFFESVNAENRYDSPRVVIKIDVEGMEEPIIDALLHSKIWASRRVICFIETWSEKVKSELLTQLNDRVLFQPKNQNAWVSKQNSYAVGESTEFCIWNSAHDDIRKTLTLLK